MITWHRLSPAILTLLVFLLAQGVGTILLLITGLLTLPDFNISLGNSLFSIILMAVDILAVLCCYFSLRYIRFETALNVTLIRWRPAMLGIAGGLFGALSISFLTDNVELPDVMLQMSLAMSHSFWGLLTLVIVGPVTEELLFREAIMGEMLRRGTSPWVAIIVSALAFSTMHLNLAQGLYALPIGILFGIIYYKTGNIVLTSLLHILNNGIVAIQLHTFGEDIADISCVEWFGGGIKAYSVMVLLGVLCIALMKRFWDCYLPCER